MKTTQIPPDTPRYPTYTPQTSHRHTPDISREHDMPTDHNRCQQTPPDILKQHLSMSWGVWRCLLTSVGMYSSLERPWGCLGDVWGVTGGIWVAFIKIGGTGMSLGGIWVLSPCSMEPNHYFGISPKCMTFFTWPYWDIKISKWPDISFLKIIGLSHFWSFLGLSEIYYLSQLLLITLY